jgi:hypothetical protein
MQDDDEVTLEDIRAAANEINSYFNELAAESARAAAILAVASLEDELERLLASKFPSGVSRTLWKQIAGPGLTPLGSFKARVDVCHAFGFFGPHTRSALMSIASVRNKFAHRTDVRTFDHEIIVEECRKLNQNSRHTIDCDTPNPALDVRQGFIRAVELYEEDLAEVRSYHPELSARKPDPLP